MKRIDILKSLFLSGACTILMAGNAVATDFNVPAGDLKSALDAYARQAGVDLVVSSSAIKGAKTAGVRGDIAPEEALTRILKGTGFNVYRQSSGALGIMQQQSSSDVLPIQLAQTAPLPARAVETVTVTSSKLGGGDVQSIPISITALSQEQLTSTQTAGGPDLIKQVPNMTFTKTNFSGYSIQIRGIGTQAISVTTDPAVAVAFNDVPFIRNHFFEQEFFDVASVEILRGPQGTLYGRNATAGVVNLTSAKPSDQFEAMASAEIGNYKQRRFEGMINLPIFDDRLALRFAGEWTKREGYSFNQSKGERTDDRNLWSGRMTIGFRPVENLQTYLIWEHFSEDDGRIRSSKQLCKRDPGPDEVNGVPVKETGGWNLWTVGPSYLSQACQRTSLYSDEAFQVPNGFSLPYWSGPSWFDLMSGVDPYASTTQSRNLRVIESQIEPGYKAKNDTVLLNVDYKPTPSLTFVSQTGFNNDYLWATQDYNRFNTNPGVFTKSIGGGGPSRGAVDDNGVFCDHQLGCSDRLVAQDLVTQNSWQLSQEFRLSSSFDGPLNFSVGGNYMHYETFEKYYVFINSLTLFNYVASVGAHNYRPNISDNSECLGFKTISIRVFGKQYSDPSIGGGVPSSSFCSYSDPNPLESLNDEGHNYFLSQNPYVLNSYAVFGETYYDITQDLKLTGGLRWTKDNKHFSLIPSWLVGNGYGYPVAGVVDQSWGEFTGRFAANWSPKLDFTDQTMIFASYAHGYKAGGANPPGAVLLMYNSDGQLNPIHPLGFKPEFVDAFELGTKNTLLDGSLTLNAGAFFYDYKNYQISEIADRTAVNRNFDARIKGAEVEAIWEPAPGLRLNFGGGWQDARVGKGMKAVDLMDRADVANHPDWMVMKPFAVKASNCIFPKYVVAALVQAGSTPYQGNPAVEACGFAYSGRMDELTGELVKLDPVTRLPFDENGPPTTTEPSGLPPPAGYQGYNPLIAPNNGEGFDKDVSGNMLPNAPPWTMSVGAQYSVPVSEDWAATLRGDFYWQDDSWWRVFNDHEYGRLHGYTNFNLTLILTSQSGWQAMAFMKNVFNTTAITGAFLNSDDSGLTTNVFLTDPKLIGLRVTKNW